MTIRESILGDYIIDAGTGSRKASSPQTHGDASQVYITMSRCTGGSYCDDFDDANSQASITYKNWVLEDVSRATVAQGAANATGAGSIWNYTQPGTTSVTMDGITWYYTHKSDQDGGYAQEHPIFGAIGSTDIVTLRFIDVGVAKTTQDLVLNDIAFLNRRWTYRYHADPNFQPDHDNDPVGGTNLDDYPWTGTLCTQNMDQFSNIRAGGGGALNTWAASLDVIQANNIHYRSTAGNLGFQAFVYWDNDTESFKPCGARKAGVHTRSRVHVWSAIDVEPWGGPHDRAVTRQRNY